MARIQASNAAKVLQIKHWLGVNENPDGDTNLKPGEACTMTNFRITNDNLMTIRPGTQNVANLLSAYDVEVGALTTVLTEINVTTATFSVLPNQSMTSGGILYISGTPATMSYSNYGTHTGKYWQSQSGNVYKAGECVYALSPGAGTHVAGGSYTKSGTVTGTFNNPVAEATEWNNSLYFYTAVKVVNGAIEYDGTAIQATWANMVNYDIIANKVYYKTNGIMYELTGKSNVNYVDGNGQTIGYGARFMGYALTCTGNDTYTWNFYTVSVVPNTSDSQVRGIWSGTVDGDEVMCAACNNTLWKLTVDGNGNWAKAPIATLDTDKPVRFFGFDSKLYILNGSAYLVWDGTALSTVAGYRPLTFVSTAPAGGGTGRERINMLNGKRRVWFSPDGAATAFKLQEAGLSSIDYVVNLATGHTYTTPAEYSINTATGTVTFTAAPAIGTNTIEIGYTYPTNLRANIEAMTLSETYNGVNDNRVFLYGDGTNKAIYSDLDYNGQATAEYFPDLNVVHVGDANTPLTSMVRHYDRLLAFKEDAAYSIRYDTITLVTGVVTAGFYCTPVNKGIGCAGYGQAVVVENHPRTLDGRSIYEWQATSSSGNITGDQRNAKRISQKVETTIGNFDLPAAISFFDKINHEHFIVQNGVAIVQNTENGAWYVYRDFPALCMIVYKDELFYGTADGFIRHVSRDYMHDIGAPITAYWESGSMDFGANYMRKYSDSLYVGIKPESKGAIKVTVQTDRQTAYDDPTVIANYTGEVDSGFFSWLDLDFEHFSFNVNDKPQMKRLKIKVKNFVYYKLIFSSVSSTTTATITSADFKVRYVGNVR